MSDGFTPRWPEASGADPGDFRASPLFTASAAWRDAADPAPPPPEEQPDPLEQARLDGFDEGYARGHEAARAEAAILREQDARARETLSLSLRKLDEQATEDLRQRLITTVQALCEASLLPLALDAAGLAARAEKAAALFMRAEDERVITLHPEDLPLVRELLPEDIVLRADATLERGALRIDTPQGGVEDGPEQWRRAIAEELGRC